MAFSVGAQSELRPVVGVQWELRGAGPRPLRALPPASGARRGDAGRDLLRPDARASLSDPASPRQAGRSPNGSAGTGSTSSLKGGHPGETSVDVCAHGGIVVTEALVCARQRPPQFPLRPYSTQELVSGEYAQDLHQPRSRAQQAALPRVDPYSHARPPAVTRRILTEPPYRFLLTLLASRCLASASWRRVRRRSRERGSGQGSANRV
jgi:hypothetical protein